MVKQSTGILVLAALLTGSVAARADMIEIRGRGILNGKIVSQDDKEVRFEDSQKNLIVVPKADVLFLEAQKDAPPLSASQKRSIVWRDEFQRWQNKFLRFFREAKRKVLRQTQGVMDLVSAPLDRTGADSKADALAQSMGDLSTSLGKMSKNDKRRTANTKMLTSGYKEFRNDSDTRSGHSSTEGGRFDSL